MSVGKIKWAQIVNIQRGIDVCYMLNNNKKKRRCFLPGEEKMKKFQGKKCKSHGQNKQIMAGFDAKYE